MHVCISTVTFAALLPQCFSIKVMQHLWGILRLFQGYYGRVATTPRSDWLWLALLLLQPLRVSLTHLPQPPSCSGAVPPWFSKKEGRLPLEAGELWVPFWFSAPSWTWLGLLDLGLQSHCAVSLHGLDPSGANCLKGQILSLHPPHVAMPCPGFTDIILSTVLCSYVGLSIRRGRKSYFERAEHMHACPPSR